MRVVVTKAKAIKLIIWAMIAILIITIFPLRLWREEIVTNSNQQEIDWDFLVNEFLPGRQMFVAQYDHLQSIGIWIKDGNTAKEIQFDVYDKNFGLLRSETVTLEEDISYPYICEIKLNMPTKVGDEYFYKVWGIDDYLLLGGELTETSGFFYNGPLYVGEEAAGGYNLITEYHYMQPLRKTMSGILILGLLVLAIFIHQIASFLEERWDKAAELVSADWGLKTIGNPLVILMGLVLTVMVVPLHLFSVHFVDIIVFELGVLLLTATLLFAINHKKNPLDQVDLAEYIKERWPAFLQSVFLALAMWACINYMNGLYEVFHDIAYRQYLIFIGLSMICTFTRKELINWYNAVILVVGAVAGVMYYKKQLPLQENIYSVTVLKLTCVLAVVIVLVAIGVIRALVSKRIKLAGISIWYASLTAVLVIGMIVFRNGRWWPVMMAVTFLLYGLRYLAWEKRGQFLDVVCNAVMFNFAGTTLFCLWCRPFVSFLITRYPHIFHTVTETGSYLAVVLAAAVVKVLHRYYETGEVSRCIKEILFFGVVASYELFTMSRTGLLAVGVMGVVLWIVMAPGKGVNKLQKMGLSCGLIVIAVLWCFPMTFTLQRNIPAVTQRLHAYEIEVYQENVKVGGKWDSDDYITFSRFAEIFANKMIGLPEDSFEWNNWNISEPVAATYLPAGILRQAFDEADTEADLEADEFDVMNGRISIFKSYLQQMNMTGHEEMGAVLEDGSLAVHAHNIYLQVAFDNGIIIGMVFILWVVCTFVQSLLYYLRNRDKDAAAALPLSVLVTFAVAGLVEWVSHPCNPLGFVILLVSIPLIFGGRKESR